jgi:hypothetical protein
VVRDESFKIKIKLFFLVPPSSPGMPEIKKVGKNNVELAWTPPTNDGGAKVTGYVVEKKPIGSDQWTKAVPFNVLDNHVLIGDLPENGEFEFRVKAVNKAGEGEPSSSTGRVKITEFPSIDSFRNSICIYEYLFRWTSTNICSESC